MRGTKAKRIRRDVGYVKPDDQDREYFKKKDTEEVRGGFIVADKSRQKYQKAKGRMK